MSREAKERRLTKAMNEVFRASWALVRDWEPPAGEMPEDLSEDEQVTLLMRAKSAECVSKILGLGVCHGEFMTIPGFVLDEGVIAKAVRAQITGYLTALDKAYEAGHVTEQSLRNVKAQFAIAVVSAVGVPTETGVQSHG